MSLSTRPDPGAGTRVGGALAGRVFGTLAIGTDLLPPRVRYGYVHRVTRRLLNRRLEAVIAATAAEATSKHAAPVTVAPASVTCALAVDDLEVGGIGSVIETLADGFGDHAIQPVILARRIGARGRALASRGIEVHHVRDRAEADDVLSRLDPRVIELHSAPAYVEAAAMESRRPLIPVLHNTEIHFTAAQWDRARALLGRSAVAIAVSEAVRDFYQLNLGDDDLRIAVVPNGAAGSVGPVRERGAARSLLAETLGVDLTADVVFACLARYDSQKNIAGTVASFLRSVETTEDRQRLVVAGDPSDWVELRRAAGIRDASRHADRVHLLGRSDPATLLAAADAFLLDSFFEGWAIAATEAATAGLPLILSDVGGARELCRHSRASILVGNPCGVAAEVSDGRVTRARRHVRRQVNADEVAAAVRRLTGDTLRRRALHLAPRLTPWPSGSTMVGAHARAVVDVASVALVRP